jgi:predicted glycosyltransferase
MEYRHTTPEMLAQAILKNIGRKVDAQSIPFDGAKKAAEIISEFLSGNL